jgi:hypothetical protein
MLKITGLDKLTNNLEDAKKALEGLDGELGTVRFNPADPGSIEAAIQEVERLVDERLGAYAANPIVGPLAESMKEKYREAIIEKAAAARLKGNEKK